MTTMFFFSALALPGLADALPHRTGGCLAISSPPPSRPNSSPLFTAQPVDRTGEEKPQMCFSMHAHARVQCDSPRAPRLSARPNHMILLPAPRPPPPYAPPPPPPLWMPCASLVGTQKTRLLRDTDLRVCRGPITTASRLRRRRAARRLVGSIASAVLPPVSSFILGFLAPALGFPEPDYYYLRTTTAMASALMPF